VPSVARLAQPPSWAVHPGARVSRGSVGNRLFKFVFDEPNNFVKVRLRGNGTSVHRDAFGSRVELDVLDSDSGESWTAYGRKVSTNGFSAQAGPDVYMGLGQADTIVEARVFWTDGTEESLQVVQGVNRIVEIHQL
jgi:hypothetical protein